jgi:hypothetical protein
VAVAVAVQTMVLLGALVAQVVVVMGVLVLVAQV